MQNFLLEAAPAGPLQALGSFLPLVLMVGVFYFLMIRPQRKREREMQEMRNRLDTGDEVITTGGIMGRVVNVREDSLVIESSADNTKLRVAKWAVQANNTAIEKAEKSKGKSKGKEKDPEKE